MSRGNSDVPRNPLENLDDVSRITPGTEEGGSSSSKEVDREMLERVPKEIGEEKAEGEKSAP